MAEAREHVRCPVCLDSFVWSSDGSDLFELDPERFEYRPINLSGLRDPQKREVRLRSAYLRCPNPSQDTGPEPHYLPVLYGRYRKPLVIGLVGASRTGKTHLLAAMMGEIEAGGLQGHGLTAVPLDMIRHRVFLEKFVQPLYRGTKLTFTVPSDLPEFVDALIVSRTGETGGHPVAFFDISGEQLAKVGKGERFLAAADGLIFVVDPEQALRLPGLAEDVGVLGDLAFSNVLDQLYRQETLLDVPAVVVVSKSDRLRFMRPADRWLAAATPAHLDAELIRMESRDVYAFLHQHGAQGWLLPAARCRRATLHFASATGGRSTDERFPRGVRPQRVLNPLIAMLAMTGVIDGPEAREVGR
ncbi:P-loop NTPase family protein [Sphaerisporangium aureirubrum]|uniref:AAA+ ATPase domain-containing protein n=1 Tax=Sphaerisporangium aureirubrum TaxID=1544736 RepID=A0ABW1NPF8_9ACTN